MKFDRRPAVPFRRGFTLIEMITAMLAATVLVGSLAASIVISTGLLETPPSEQEVRRDRGIEDRLRSDLRYAISIDSLNAEAFDIVRPHPVTGALETIHYQADRGGLTRQVESGATAELDPQAPKPTWLVDGYSAPTHPTATHVVRVCGSSHAATVGTSTELDVPVPAGLKAGDHVWLCVSAKSPDSLTIDHAGWQELRNFRFFSLRLFVAHRAYDDSWPAVLRLNSTPASAMAAVMVAAENADPIAPVDWSATSGGVAWKSIITTHPSYLQSTGWNDRQLNLQIFAAEKNPWPEATMGLAGFGDVIQATAAQGNAFYETSIGVVVRNGAAPSMSFTPRLIHQASGIWLGTAARVEVSP